MSSNILDTPLLRYPRAWWLPLLSLALNLSGIIFLGWNVQPVVFMFWYEVILILAFAIIRMLFAMNEQPWHANIWQKAGMLAGGMVLGGAMVLLTVTFTFKAFEGGFVSNGFEHIPFQTKVLLLGYIAGLGIHYFGNGYYRKARPMSEWMPAFIHVLILLVLIMPVTMHLLPRYPDLNQAVWVAVTVVLVKFVVDALFSRIGHVLKREIPR